MKSDKDVKAITEVYDTLMGLIMPSLTPKLVDTLRIAQFKAIINLFTEHSVGAVTEKTEDETPVLGD